MDKNDIEIRLLQITDLYLDALQDFNRYQITNRVMYKKNDEYMYKDNYFIEYWDELKKEQVIQSLIKCICTGGIVVGAFKNNKLIGFANVENKFFGKYREYLELPYIHVSYEFRNYGIGRQLFHLCCEKAREKGAKKLYIGAHPSEETQIFYKSIGCTLAVEVNKEIYKREPLDIQLEFAL
ncbi:GNAT family N-acetyltransferase [Tissierella carlieri]|uniref:GNAT family N-acetyltransferase n=1 Tax=Tissierella carlieri TaxID=689904 RepID=UPI00386E8B04